MSRRARKSVDAGLAPLLSALVRRYDPLFASGSLAEANFMRSLRRSTGLSSVAMLVFAACVVTTVACGSAPSSSEDVYAEPNPTCVRGLTPTSDPTLRTAETRALSTPDLRPDSTRMTEIDGIRRDRFEATRNLIATGCDPRNLPMVVFSHLDGLPPRNLQEALDRSDLVFTAQVVNTEFSIDEGDPSPSARTVLIPEITMKGDAPSEVVLYQMGGPVPDRGGVVAILLGEPVLFRGDRVLLFVQRRENLDGYRSTYPLGKYYIGDDRIISVPEGNPCDWLDGRTIEDILSLLRASQSGDTQDAAQPCDWTRF